MSGQRLPMRQVREVLRLKHVCGYGGQQMAAMIGATRYNVADGAAGQALPERRFKQASVNGSTLGLRVGLRIPMMPPGYSNPHPRIVPI